MKKDARLSAEITEKISWPARRLSRLFTPKGSRLLAAFFALALAIFVFRDSIVNALQTVSESFDTPAKVASRSDITLCGGQMKLAATTWTSLDECNCNSLPGWYWYTTNGRSACWSKTLADSVSWNKGMSTLATNAGDYACATSVTPLRDRMIAVSSGEWYKVVTQVNGVSVTSSHNGSAGWSTISAVAIADCLDGTRDLCSGACLDNTVLAAWATATGTKSALPYCTSSGCNSSANSDYRAACEQNSNFDFPLNCNSSVFNQNKRNCADTDNNNIWSAFTASTTQVQLLGGDSCSQTAQPNPSNSFSYDAFRVVVRP